MRSLIMLLLPALLAGCLEGTPGGVAGTDPGLVEDTPLASDDTVAADDSTIEDGFADPCCQTDDDCGPGHVCLLAACVPEPAPGQCYQDGDCSDPYMSCLGAELCPCGDPCPASTTGSCGCGLQMCFVDFPCYVDYPGMTPPFCHGDRVIRAWQEVSCYEACGTQCCSGGGCDILESEQCDQACGLLPEPGQVGCVDCCVSDDNCPDGAVCVCFAGGGCDGSCQRAPGPGECWDDSDCDNGQLCGGAVKCPCKSTWCYDMPAPGSCT